MSHERHYSDCFNDVEAPEPEEKKPSTANEARELAIKLFAAQSNLVDFRRSFLPVEGEVDSPWYHYKWSDILLKSNKNFVVEGFRESAKSSLVIKGHSLHCMTYPKRSEPYTVFILQNTKKAQGKLEEIVKAYLDSPEMSSNLVSVIDFKPHLGYFEAEVEDDKGSFHIRLEAYGKGAAIRGMSWNDKRPSKVVIDDPQDLEDAESETTLEKDWDWFLSEVRFLGKNTRLFLIGNNLGQKCIVERTIEFADILGFESMVVPIWDDKEVPNWEAMFDRDFIRKEKAAYKEMGKPDIWWRERMCKPMAPSSQRFQREMFRYYDPQKIDDRVRDMELYITLDLAVGQSKRSDYTVICVVGVDKDNNWFVLDMDYGRFNPTETMDRIFKAVIWYNPFCVGIETVAFQAAMAHFLEREMSERNLFFNIEPLKSEKKKELRIEAIHPRFTKGKIFFPSEAPFRDELEEELLRFPKGTHDDLIDALAYMDQIAAPPSLWGRGRGDDIEIPVAGGM